MKIEQLPQPVESPPAEPPAWPAGRVLAAGLVAAVAVWMLSLHADTLISMVAIWNSSDTFAHGYAIFPISAWLIWQRRHAVAAIELRPQYLVLPAILLAGFTWYFAGLARVGVVQQFAMVATIPLIVWAMLGTRLTLALAFPLAFLVFAVPVGEFAERLLMEHTADFTVAALRLTGIPVFREGQYFTIPSGSWSVVEACSGLRYLIASVTVGVLYAHLTYRSAARQAAFIAASIVVPVVANWFRAYMIVMIGHLSEMRYAVGVDHLIYGWIFFGVVMMLLFWVGSFWREDTAAPGASPAARAQSGAPRVSLAGPALGPIAAAAVATALATAVWPLAADRQQAARDVRPIVIETPSPAGWMAAPGETSTWSPRYLGARAYANQVFARGPERVGLHVRYYRNQGPYSQLVSSDNELVASNNRAWKASGEVRRTVIVNGGEIPFAETRLTGHVQNLLVWRVYWIDGRLVTNAYWAKLLQARAVLFGRGDDGAAVFVFAPYETRPDGARSAVSDFTAAALPALTASLEAARNAPVR